MNKSPACAWRESVVTRVNDASLGPFASVPPQAVTTNCKSRACTFHFRAKVAVTTAVIVLSTDEVSLAPSQLNWPLYRGVI